MTHRSKMAALCMTLILTACTTAGRLGITYGRTEQQQASSAGHSSILQLHADSALYYWYYCTDSTFYYHPDSGLYGYAGQLMGLQQYSGRSLMLHLQDSTHNYSRIEDRAETYSWQDKVRSYALWLLAGTFILVLLIRTLWKRLG